MFSHDEGEDDANEGPVSRFEEKMAAQAAAAVEDGTPLAACRLLKPGENIPLFELRTRGSLYCVDPNLGISFLFRPV